MLDTYRKNSTNL